MKNLHINLVEKTITMTKAFERKANVYGSKEYEELSEVLTKHPTFDVQIRKIKSNPNKKTYKYLTYDNMKSYIRELNNSKELLEEFEKQKNKAVIVKNKYRYMLNWFKANCFKSDEEFEGYRNNIAQKSAVNSPVDSKQQVPAKIYNVPENAIA